MKRFLQLFIVCACLSAYSLPALSWGQKGHRVIAKIAYDNMNRKAKKAVDKTLGKGGIGLKSARVRLEQLCGGSLDICRENGWTVIRIRLPGGAESTTDPADG